MERQAIQGNVPPMAQRTHLSKAPINEALVDIRTRALNPITSPDVAARLEAALAPSYTRHESMLTYEGRVVFPKGAAEPQVQSGETRTLGHRFLSPDGKDIAQFRLDGFTYNRLPPYRDGDNLIDEALRLWPHYVEIAAPREVKRLALRYINRLDGVKAESLGDWLQNPPSVPKGAPNEIESFATRIVNTEHETGLRVRTGTRFDPPMTPGGSSALVLDIDASVLGDFGTDPTQLKPILQHLRQLKNDVFFGSITDRVVETYK